MDMDKEQFVAYKLDSVKTFDPLKYRNEDVATCTRHPGVPSTHVVHLVEEGFTEYDGMCQGCYEAAKASAEALFDKLINEVQPEPSEYGREFLCESCQTWKPYFVLSSDKTKVRNNFRNYVDPEDRSWTDMCVPCHQKATSEYLKYIEGENYD